MRAFAHSIEILISVRFSAWLVQVEISTVKGDRDKSDGNTRRVLTQVIIVLWNRTAAEPTLSVTLSASPYFTARYFVRWALRTGPYFVSREICSIRDVARWAYFSPKWENYKAIVHRKEREKKILGKIKLNVKKKGKSSFYLENCWKINLWCLYFL